MDLEKIRHSASHVLADAVLSLFPDARPTIGPTIEDGFYYDFYNLKIEEKDLKKIEKKMKEIINKNLKFKKVIKTRKEAEKFYKDNKFKKDILKNDIKGDKIQFYQHGDFLDLCKGNHTKSTRDIKALKLLKTSGSYWRGDSKKEQLTRIYGTVFESEKELKEYLNLLKEAEKRDHRKIGKQMELFSIHEEGPGFIFLLPKGIIIWNELVNFWREKHKEDYIEIKTPQMLNKDLWQTSGHWDYYRKNMYTLKIDNQDFAIKPMNCPGGILVYTEKLHSYKELPLRVAEIGLVHRHELAGVVSGLFRVRAFHQDDAHLYCLPEQAEEEVNKVIDLVMDMYKTFGFKDYEFEISTKPDKYVGTDKMWDKATKTLQNVLMKRKIKYNIDEGAGVFYGPKIDVKIRDAIGRKWQCATIQYDFNLPERFNLSYEGRDGKKHAPIMLHRVIYGSLERFLGILIEHYAGNFPLWLSPIQIKILTLNDDCIKFAKKVFNKLKENNIRVEMDNRSESLPKKVRDAEVEKIPLILTIGEKEVKNKTLAVRDSKGKVNFGVKVDSFIKQVIKEIKDKKT